MDEPWRLDFLLQARDDPSLVVPMAQVWEAPAGVFAGLVSESVDPQEVVLRDLGRAVRLCPLLEPALDDARPSGAALSAHDAFTFLRDAAPLLVQAGFGVQTPPWWGQATARLGLRARVRGPAGEGGLVVVA